MIGSRGFSRRLAPRHSVVAVASALALAACSADGEGEVIPNPRIGQLGDATSAEPAPAGSVAGSPGVEAVPVAEGATSAAPQPTAAPVDLEAEDVPAQAPGEALQYSVAAAGFSCYVALGDSFVSGVGASVVGGPCGASWAAWPFGVQAGLGNLPITFAACSGATTQDVVTAMGGLRMRPQMSMLPPPEHLGSALITIAIGGNDIKLEQSVRKCFQGASSLSSSLSLAQSACWDLEQLLNNLTEVVNGALAPSLDYTFRALRAAAPSATIVAIGYPHVVDTSSPNCDRTATGYLLNLSKRQRLNQLVDALNAQIKTAAANAGIASIIDPIVAAFQGHEACSADEWIVSADALLRTGNFGVGHPNDAGYRAYANAVLRALPTVTTR